MVARWYAAVLPRFAHGILLDLGCGKAPYYSLYAPLVQSILCTDWAHSLHGDEYLDFVSDFDNYLPLVDECVDTIIMSDVLEHVYRPQQVLNETYRLLRPGGVAVINTPFMYPVHEAPHDYYRYTQYAMKRMVEDAGFIIEVIDPLGGKLIALAEIAGKVLQGIAPVFALIAAGLQRGAVALSGRLPRTQKFPTLIGTVIRKPPVPTGR